jgi:hypothetical protein
MLWFHELKLNSLSCGVVVPWAIVESSSFAVRVVSSFYVVKYVADQLNFFVCYQLRKAHP